jgi:hypothetical protein
MLIWNPDQQIDARTPRWHGLLTWLESYLERCRKFLGGW